MWQYQFIQWRSALHRPQTQPSPSRANNRLRIVGTNFISVHDLWIPHDPPRIEASAQTNICFDSISWVKHCMPVAKKLNRPRPVQTIEWVNSARACEVRMLNRKKTKWKYRSATHAHFHCSCLIRSFHCLHWTRTVDFAATGVLVYQQNKYQTNFRLSRCSASDNVVAMRRKNIRGGISHSTVGSRSS